MNDIEKLATGFEQARQINREYGKSYYWATQLLPGEKKRATHALYAFFRLADDIVDCGDIRTAAERSRAEIELGAFEEAWRNALEGDDSSLQPALASAAYTMKHFAVPYDLSYKFLASMRMDLTKLRYDTYAELDEYMYGSAACVGLMMSYVLGFDDETALPDLGNLGIAMQLTNFLRDVDEDYHVYGRVYLPLEDLDRFGLCEREIADRRFSPAWRDLMEFESHRATNLYRQANRAIQSLHADGRLPVRLASVLYHAILAKLREQNYNVFAGRASTSVLEKCVLTLQTVTQSYE